MILQNERIMMNVSGTCKDIRPENHTSRHGPQSLRHVPSDLVDLAVDADGNGLGQPVTPDDA